MLSSDYQRIIDWDVYLVSPSMGPGIICLMSHRQSVRRQLSILDIFVSCQHTDGQNLHEFWQWLLWSRLTLSLCRADLVYVIIISKESIILLLNYNTVKINKFPIKNQSGGGFLLITLINCRLSVLTQHFSIIDFISL